jgi:hypothetical protein
VGRGLKVEVVVQSPHNSLLVVVNIIASLLDKSATILSSRTDNPIVAARDLTVELVPLLLRQFVVVGCEPPRLKAEPDPKPQCASQGKSASDQGVAFWGTEV